MTNRNISTKKRKLIREEGGGGGEEGMWDTCIYIMSTQLTRRGFFVASLLDSSLGLFAAEDRDNQNERRKLGVASFQSLATPLGMTKELSKTCDLNVSTGVGANHLIHSPT